NKHIKNDTTTPVKDSAEFKPFAGKELRVFPTDADIPKDALNGKIDETFVPRAKVELPEKGKFAEWKHRLVDELRKRSFRAFPERIPAGNKVKNGERLLPWPHVATEPGIELALVVMGDDSKESQFGGILVLNEE